MLQHFLKLLSAMFFVIFPLTTIAQTTQNTTEQQDSISLPFMKRFSIRTNVVDWIVATPNLGLELDLSGSPKTRFSVLVNGKWNWNTSHSVAPRIIYNVAAGSVEARKYWRTGGTLSGTKPFKTFTKDNRDSTVSLPRWGFQRFRRNVLSGRTFKDPRIWRAYYAGVYAGYEKYTISLGREGKQGDSYNFGFTGGWSIPLYPFKDGRTVDLDLGLAIGAKMTEYDMFRYEEETACYVYQGTKGRHFVPYPVIQDVHVSFIFRFQSISKKVQGGAERYEKWENEVYDVKRTKREKIRQRNWDIRDSMYQVRRVQLKRDSLHNDSIKQKYREKQQLDSIQREAKKAEAEKIKQATKQAAGEKEKASKKKDKKKKSSAGAEGASGEPVGEENSEGKKEEKSKKEKKSKKRKKDDASEARNMDMKERSDDSLAFGCGNKSGRKEVALA